MDGSCSDSPLRFHDWLEMIEPFLRNLQKHIVRQGTKDRMGWLDSKI